MRTLLFGYLPQHQKKLKRYDFPTPPLLSSHQFQQDWDMGDADYIDQPFDVDNELDTHQSNGKACLVCI